MPETIHSPSQHSAPPPPDTPQLADLARSLEGELHWDLTWRRLYATDASAYQELPLAVAIPRSEPDLRAIVRFAGRHRVGLIPRTAGTSLAGQVVGGGLVVDCSKHFGKILEIDRLRKRVRVQPGVIRNELNMALAPHGLLFGPETSTANRAMIGGMIGNNSCGSNSVVYGSTRDHLLEVRALLSNGEEVRFHDLSPEEFDRKCALPEHSLEGRIYRHIRQTLAHPDNRRAIRRGFPRPSIPRRNTGYALDLLMESSVFDPDLPHPFNFCRLVAGSEGTLCLILEATLGCVPLPPPEAALICAHFPSVDEALRANLLALDFQPFASELIDRHILECTRRSLAQRENRFFVQGDPGAILVVELRDETEEALQERCAAFAARCRAAGLGYHFPVLRGEEMGRVWDLRRAGQGLLSNIPGDTKPVEVIEDTAVDVRDLPAYIREMEELLRAKYGKDCVFYAHAGSGELHTRPLINLKTEEGNLQFRQIASDVAALVKKYQGSLSGEHGDGRLRGEFIPFMVGEHNYQLFRQLKAVWDPHGLLNPDKIVDTPPMNSGLRHMPGQGHPEVSTTFDFSQTGGILRAAEQCSGSGDCRKTELTGGTMCPSYMATREEKDSTRARANLLRHLLTGAPDRPDPLASEALHEIMDLCLSCKGCKAECPSNVDVARLKAEVLQHHHDLNGVPWRSRLVANFERTARIGAIWPSLYNAVLGQPTLARVFKRVAGFAPQRSLPRLSPMTLRQWMRRRPGTGPRSSSPVGRVLLFADEFTNHTDLEVGQAQVEVLEALGYVVELPAHRESARASISKGLIRRARGLAEENVRLLSPLVGESTPLVGIEPSALLGFRDEYPDLVRPEWKEAARAMAPHCLLFEEFIDREAQAGRITSRSFDQASRQILIHGHCHQKALSSLTPLMRTLKLGSGHSVSLIRSGCCGMAGSFGYEAEHFEISQKVGELVLFPAVRKASPDAFIVAPGTSCRHQIWDGTGRRALHPAQVLRQALIHPPPQQPCP